MEEYIDDYTWVSCSRFPKYEVNEHGDIRNAKTKRILSPTYLSVRNKTYMYTLYDLIDQSHYVELKRLVAESFNGGPHDDCDVDFLDGDFTNLNPRNLVWVKLDRSKKYVDKEPSILVVETGEIFDSLDACCRVLNITRRSAKDCLTHPYLMCSKNHYHLKYIEED